MKAVGRYGLAALVAAIVSVLALLLVQWDSGHKQQAAALQASATPSAAVLAPATDPAWSKLLVIEQRTLEPLRSAWPTMTAEQQDKWRLIADGFQGKSGEAKHRLAVRIAEWARLSPQQRAKARLNFLQLAKRYSSRQRKEQWQAYQTAKPGREPPAVGRPQHGEVPPAFVQTAPGATTVLLSQLSDLRSLPGPAKESGEAAPVTPATEVAVPQNTGAASAAAATAGDAEPVGP